MIYFTSDWHLGHNGIVRILKENNQIHLRGNCQNQEEHDRWLISQHNSVVKKDDTVYVLGDACFNLEGLKKVSKFNGKKYLLRGNHDQLSDEALRRYFKGIIGFRKHKGFWLSHAPVHPGSLRGLVNIHGHVHGFTLEDPNYINVSVENTDGIPISLAEARMIQTHKLAFCNLCRPDVALWLKKEYKENAHQRKKR